ncbi:hypothetical protein ACFUN8_08100 [Streptomyces sp. NPDC057307]|uniref:hypothetical protein n=1 Tax=Streptomyces sp. NPDC057307 TaxID=3346096 RepID=UPI003641F31E
MALNAHPDRPGLGNGVAAEGEFDETDTETGAGTDTGTDTGTEADAETGAELLPCGRELSVVWEAWDAVDGSPGAVGPRVVAPDIAGWHVSDPHLVECPYCSAALADLAALGEAVDRTREAVPPGPAEVSDLTTRVMDIVRLELRPGRSLPLGEPDEDLWIVEAAAARAFRAAAESLPGVRAGSCRISPRERGPVNVRLEVAAALHLNLPELAEEIRARVADSARDAIGIEVESIDVLVIDLFDDDDDDGEEEGEEDDADVDDDDDEEEGGDGR